MTNDDSSQAGHDARTDSYRYNWRSARLLAFALGGLFVLTAFAAVVGPGFDPKSRDLLFAVLALLFLGSLLGVMVYLMLRPPVMLRIGPDGLYLPVGFRRPMPWNQIHRIRRMPERKYLLQRFDLLVVDPSPGVLPDYRFAGPRRMEKWWLRRVGIRIPLHDLDAKAEVVIASIERFRPVWPAKS